MKYDRREPFSISLLCTFSRVPRRKGRVAADGSVLGCVDEMIISQVDENSVRAFQTPKLAASWNDEMAEKNARTSTAPAALTNSTSNSSGLTAPDSLRHDSLFLRKRPLGTMSRTEESIGQTEEENNLCYL